MQLPAAVQAVGMNHSSLPSAMARSVHTRVRMCKPCARSHRHALQEQVRKTQTSVCPCPTAVCSSRLFPMVLRTLTCTGATRPLLPSTVSPKTTQLYTNTNMTSITTICRMMKGEGRKGEEPPSFLGIGGRERERREGGASVSHRLIKYPPSHERPLSHWRIQDSVPRVAFCEGSGVNKP